MHYLQSLSFKISILLICYSITAPGMVFGQGYEQLLNKADSLFSLKKYTQSYQLYDSIYEDQMSSPQMLLKMAYIQEGLGNYTNALLHLNDYYILTSDERALEKMENLASAYDLVGYDYSESDFVLNIYRQYHDQLIIAFSLISLIFLAGISYQKFKLKTRPVSNFILFTFSISVLAAILNFGIGHREAIINHPDTYIMSDPASSSRVLAIVSEGNKVPIKKSHDVWVQTEWENQKAYIRRKNLTPVLSW